jgi:hypothetical protein
MGIHDSNHSQLCMYICMGKKMTMTLVSKNIAIFPPKIGRNCRKNDHNIDPPRTSTVPRWPWSPLCWRPTTRSAPPPSGASGAHAARPAERPSSRSGADFVNHVRAVIYGRSLFRVSFCFLTDIFMAFWCRSFIQYGITRYFFFCFGWKSF